MRSFYLVWVAVVFVAVMATGCGQGEFDPDCAWVFPALECGEAEVKCVDGQVTLECGDKVVTTNAACEDDGNPPAPDYEQCLPSLDTALGR